MWSFRRGALAVGLGITAGLTGCGTSAPNCSGAGLVLQVSPAAVTADHLAAVPGNVAQFTGVATYAILPGCPVPALAVREFASWTNPDPADIQISSANDATNGRAVCKGATNGSVTLTGAFAPLSLPPTTQSTAKTVLLTCK